MFSPLHDAVVNNDVDRVIFFVEKGLYIDARDDDNQTPLQIAMALDYKLIIRILTSPKNIWWEFPKPDNDCFISCGEEINR